MGLAHWKMVRTFCNVSGIAVFFVLLFGILLYKNLVVFQDLPVSHWHQEFIDYDLDWTTPWLSFGGNLLHQFGMQPPFDAHLSPFLGFAHRFCHDHEIALSVICFYLATCTLLWFVGWKIGLRPVPRMVFAGLVGLITTLPYGPEKVIPGVPPLLLVSQSVTSRYWQEASILTLTAVFLFSQLGLAKRTSNLALAFGFITLCLVVLFAYPGLAFFSLPVIVFYCLAFAFTAKYVELRWKVVAGGLLAALLLLMSDFFINLYSYTFGTYFAGAFSSASSLRSSTDTASLLKYTTMMGPAFWYEPRVLFVFVVSLVMAGCLVFTPGFLRRFAIAVLFCEFGIITLGIVNALVTHAPVSMYYSEQLTMPFLIAFFVLLLLAVFNQLPRYALLSSVAVVIVLAIAWMVPSRAGYPSSRFPPAPPAPLLKELVVKPGEPFHGRVLSLFAMNARPQDFAQLENAVFNVENKYGHYLGNDYWIDLMHFNIPVVNELNHWTSPMSFLFLRTFFGYPGDDFDKAVFFLRHFDERMARLIGVRYIVSDAKVPEGQLVYETVAGKTPLYIHRLDKVNLGQYSPTRMFLVDSAAEAISRIVGFDPESDVIVEGDSTVELVPGKLLSFNAEVGPSFSVKAESTGRSLLVLPIEYSHCLQLENGGSAQLIPVNLLQTGLLFEHKVDAKISYHFGPFNSQCRGDDLERVNRLQLHEVLQ